MENKNTLKYILVGAVVGLAVGIGFSTLLVSYTFRIFSYNLPGVGVWIYNHVGGARVAVPIFFLVFGCIIGWMVGRFKKEVVINALTKKFLIFLILIFVLMISFYAFTFTVTYECSVQTAGDIQAKDSCYSSKLICEKVANPNLKSSCYVGLAQYKADLGLCDKVLGASEKNRCVALVAGQKSDSKICESITNQTGKDFCYYTSASWKNPNICEKTSGQNAKNSCYFTIGIQLCDESMCQKITDVVSGNLKLDCIAAVARDRNDEYRPGGSCRFIREERAKLLESR